MAGDFEYPERTMGEDQRLLGHLLKVSQPTMNQIIPSIRFQFLECYTFSRKKNQRN
jgi:hypothetical protein